jgi:hypothetical protein
MIVFHPIIVHILSLISIHFGAIIEQLFQFLYASEEVIVSRKRVYFLYSMNIGIRINAKIWHIGGIKT